MCRNLIDVERGRGPGCAGPRRPVWVWSSLFWLLLLAGFGCAESGEVDERASDIAFLDAASDTASDTALAPSADVADAAAIARDAREDDADASERDAHADGRADASEAENDGGLDVAVDATPDGSAAPDTASDAPSDAGADAGADAEPPLDGEGNDAPHDAGAPPPSGPITYLALGDSYTIGESVTELERWPVQLVVQLEREGVDVAPGEPVIIARTGWTTSQLLNAMDEPVLAPSYSMVSVLIGVNNQFQRGSIDTYRTELGVILERAVGLAEGDPSRVFALSIPDYGATPFGQRGSPGLIGAAIDRFNDVKREECEARGIAYVDITPISREGIERPELVASDGLHPSGVMYAEFVAEALPTVRAILGAEPAE